MENKESLIKKVKCFAIKAHEDVNQLYDGKPYDFHLQLAINAFNLFKHYIPAGKEENVECAIWVHDCIEDTQHNYNSIVKVAGEEVAELAYAVTNEKGKNRKERANAKYYRGIRYTPNATFVKLCDRLANIHHSNDTNSRMIGLYRKEHESFVSELYDPKLDGIFVYMNQILNLPSRYNLKYPLYKRMYRGIEKFVYLNLFKF